MKQTQFVLLATITLAGATLANTAGVKAADAGKKFGIEAPATATTTAEFNVTAGKLTLDAAPDLLFGDKDATIASIMNGAEIKQTGNDTKELDSDTHKDSTSPLLPEKNTLQVSDYRGMGKKWNLKAKIGEFTDGNGTAEGTITFGDSAKLGLAGKKISSTDKTILTSADVVSENSAVLEGASTATELIGAGATTLVLSKQNNIQAGQYNAEITWTLSDGDGGVAPRN